VTDKESSVRARWKCAGSSGAALLLLPAVAAAADLNLAPRPWLVLTNLVVVLLLIWPVNRLLIAPLVGILKEREARTQGSTDQTGAVRSEAAAELARLEARRSEARRQAAERRSAILARGKSEEQRVLDAARGEAAQSLAQVRASIAADVEQARASLSADARALAQLAAERILGRTL
jgi:F-type H+-transporting ATPase subunit b